MNVFVLCTGRCGSTTFIKACHHIVNFTAAHQSRCCLLAAERLHYPANHIEADNRLSWFLGRLDEKYGDKAFYVHLVRNRRETAESFAKRFGPGITGAYYPGIVTQNKDLEGFGQQLPPEQKLQVCLDLWDTVNTNIALFLKDKSQKLRFDLAHAQDHFREFWQRIGARGDLQAALNEWNVMYNASEPKPGPYVLRRNKPLTLGQVVRKITRTVKKLPRFLIET